MTRTRRIVAVLAVALMPCVALAQSSPEQTTEAAVATAPIPPDQQATKAQLAKLFEVMRLRQQFDGMIKMLPAMVQQQMHAQMKEMLAQMPAGKTPTPEQEAALDKLMKKYMEKAVAIYPADELIDDATTVYQRHMTRTDVDAFIAFYSSPAGQHLLDAQPVIMQEYMPMVMQRIQSRTKELYLEMAGDMQEFLKESAPQGSAGSATPAETPAAK